MKVLLYGHSYVRDLNQKCDWSQPLTIQGQAVRADYSFRYFPGKDYEFLLHKPQEFEILASINPEYIVVILGGNSIVASKSNQEINGLATEFYQRLRASLPNAVIIATQIEPRYYPENNHFEAPPREEFNRRRVALNTYVNKRLRRRGLVNYVAVLGSAANYGPYSFRDGVHLMKGPLVEYQQNILGALIYAAEHQ